MFKKLIILIVLSLLIVIGIAYFSAEKNQFPNIEIGVYQGEISFFDENTFKFMLVRPSLEPIVLVSVFKESWVSQKVKLPRYEELLFDGVKRILNLPIPDFKAFEYVNE